MRIAIITPYQSFSGGVEIVNNTLKNIFEEQGYSVVYITVEGYTCLLHDKIMTKVIGLPYITKKRFQSIENHFDIVIANGEFGFGINHPKTINLFHGSYKGLRDYLRRQYSIKQFIGLSRQSIIQKISAKKKYVVAVSEFTKDILERDGIKVHQVISNSIDTDFFKPLQQNKTKYLFVGVSNYYAKGFDILEDLADQGYSIDCVTDTKPSEKLGWIKNLNNAKMPEIYNRYKMLIFPSRFEGMPLVPLEAMACGLPIVMSNVGLGPELKKEIPEFVVERHNAEYYVHKIKNIERNYDKFSLLAREYVKIFHSYENYRAQWLELIERI